MAVCLSCGTENPDSAKFCNECAASLTEAPSPGLEERKVVTVLFCDLVGFTAASEQADPEDVRARISPYFARLRQEIERYGGTVEKFIGDAVMAVFGAPVAHEDDAERAVRAGLGILEAMAELNAEDSTLALQVRVGINTGEAVVAIGPGRAEGEGFITGDVVNTASRLQGVAPVNGIGCSETTYRQTERVFDFDELEPVTVKGKTEALRLYRPLQAHARFGSDVTRTHTTPLVGRELEKSLIIGTFERSAQQSSCQLVTIVGEPGAGKSRLCMELLNHVDERPVLTRWRQGRCLPYGDGIAFWALGEIVKAECGIFDTDSVDEAEAKLERALPGEDADLLWLKARLGPLVGVTSEAAAQEETFTAWRRFCEHLAGTGPVVLVFEDLHWADPALLAFLEHMAEWAEGVPLLLLCTARPELYEQHPGFGANARNAQRIHLPPLTDDETARLVGSLLERSLLPAKTQQALLERAGGNPLYAEEFVRLLTDRGDLGEDMEVPESVQALIAARLDTLPADRKSLLQDAAVLGKVFWAGALAEMGGRDLADVEIALHELSRKELVRPARTSSMEEEAEYGFWHVLVRDVCYAQIPRAARAARHRAAVKWIERKAAERLEDLADVLAYHYLQALELGRAAGDVDTAELEEGAIRYLALAGERALGLDVDRAEQHLARALELAPPGYPDRALLLERWAQAIQQQGRPQQEAKQAFEEAFALYRDLGEPVAAGRVLLPLAIVVHRTGDEPRSKALLDEAVELLEAQPAGPELVSAYAHAAGWNALTEHFAESIAAAERALVLAEELGLPEPAFALQWRGLARSELGDAEGLEDMGRSLQLALEQGLGRETAVIYGNLGFARGVYSGPAASLSTAREAIEFCERRGITELALQNRAHCLSVLAALGRTEEALAELGPTVDRIEAMGDKVFTYWRGEQMRLLAERGTPDEAPDPDELVAAARAVGQTQTIQALGDAVHLLLARGERQHAQSLLHELDELTAARADLFPARQFPSLVRDALDLDDEPLVERLVQRFEAKATVPFDEHVLASARAQLAEAAGDRSAAAELYREAVERWREFGRVPELAYALLGQGRCLAALGQPAAEEPLREAKELFSWMGYKPALAETEALLAETAAAAS